MIERLEEAVVRIDAANAEDPNVELVNGQERPKELVYSERMTRWLARLAPDASEALRLAVRAQHLQRWKIPRAEFPDGRAGYRRWRAVLAESHADSAATILAEVGYESDAIDRVKALIRKQNLETDAEAQVLEDVACLVFLESYLADFAKQHDKDKLVGILRKTWRKMSPGGREAALVLEMPAEARALLEKALPD